MESNQNTTREAHVGETVIFCDPKGTDYPALITAVWSAPCINVVYVSGDETRKDSYGRQIERQTSVMHVSTAGAAHGNYWRFSDEEKRAFVPPLEQ